MNDLKAWLRVGYGLVFISAAQLTLSQSSDILLVAALRDRTQAAHYSIASQLAMLVAFASTAVMFIVAPMISELYAKQQMDTLRRFTRATTTVCTAFALTLLIGIVAFGRPLLGIFGASFTDAYPALLVLAVSQCVSATIGALSGWIMTMTGHERPAAWMIGGSALLNIALAFPLTVAYGPVGTATATSDRDPRPLSHAERLSSSQARRAGLPWLARQLARVTRVTALGSWQVAADSGRHVEHSRASHRTVHRCAAALDTRERLGFSYSSANRSGYTRGKRSRVASDTRWSPHSAKLMCEIPVSRIAASWAAGDEGRAPIVATPVSSERTRGLKNMARIGSRA